MDLLVSIPFTKVKIGGRLHRGNGWAWAEGGIYGETRETAISGGLKSNHAGAALRHMATAVKSRLPDKEPAAA